MFVGAVKPFFLIVNMYWILWSRFTSHSSTILKIFEPSNWQPLLSWHSVKFVITVGHVVSLLIIFLFRIIVKISRVTSSFNVRQLLIASKQLYSEHIVQGSVPDESSPPKELSYVVWFWGKCKCFYIYFYFILFLTQNSSGMKFYGSIFAFWYTIQYFA